MHFLSERWCVIWRAVRMESRQHDEILSSSTLYSTCNHPTSPDPWKIGEYAVIPSQSPVASENGPLTSRPRHSFCMCVYPPKNIIPESHERYADMKQYGNRLASFRDKWPKEDVLSAQLMASAGFFYKGPHDRVECGYCRGRMENFVRGDNPVVEHARHFPGCTFIHTIWKPT